jgi:hypothetical protein
MIQSICLLFILLWIYAAVSKLIDYDKFIVQLSQSPILTRIARFVSILIPLLEVAIASLLIFERSRFVGLLASFGLMVTFTAYIFAVTRFTKDVPCSCGGILEKLGWDAHLIFNTVFTLLALVAVITEQSFHQERHISSA